MCIIESQYSRQTQLLNNRSLAISVFKVEDVERMILMSKTVNCTEDVVIISNGTVDNGKLAALGDGGKFHPSVIPVIDELQEQITKEVTERTEGDKALQTNIDAETSARISVDQQLQGNIEAESSARVNGDKDLEDKITAEVTARTNGDTQLQANLDAEADTRSIADQNLQDQISKEIVERTAGDTALQTSIDVEVAARIDADSKLQSSIDFEVDARTKADQSLQQKIDALEGKNAFSNVVVNGEIIKADSQEDTIELEAGTNIALTADMDSDKVTIAVTGKVASAEQSDSAIKLETARNINGVPFDGSRDITITQVNGKTIATTDQIFDQKIYIVGSGSGADSYWRKWSNGDMEIFGYTAAVVNTSGAVSFPITLNEVKMFLPSQVGAGWPNGCTLRPIDVTTTGFSYNWDGFNKEGIGKPCMIAYHVLGTVTV